MMSMPGSREVGVALAGTGPDPPVICPLSAVSRSSLLLAFSSTVDIIVEKPTLPSFKNLAPTQTEMGSIIM